MIPNHLPTEELQALDAAHHAVADGNALAAKGARVITGARGIWLTDSDGRQLVDGMSGLWCVNIGYGRDSLADVAAAQMKQLPYYVPSSKPLTPPSSLWQSVSHSWRQMTSTTCSLPAQAQRQMTPIFAWSGISGRRRASLKSPS